jgi:hypothetical protein
VTVAAPLGAGYGIVRSSFDATSQANDLEVLLAAKWFPVMQYLWMVGSAAIAVATALILALRFRWSTRRRAMAIAGVLLALGGYVLLARVSLSQSVLEPSREALFTTPINLDRIENRCARYNYWTGGVQPTRAVITGASCNTIELYRGWSLAWKHDTPGAPVDIFTSMDGTYITSSGPNREVLEAVSATNGQALWRQDCPTGWSLDTSEQDDLENTPAVQRLGATCGGTAVSLDPRTGAPT